MQYIKCLWEHNFPSEPVLLYSEIDDDRYETRKVEYYADGSFGIASEAVEIGATALGTVPVPPIEKINNDPEFLASDISMEEFEEVWTNLTS